MADRAGTGRRRVPRPGRPRWDVLAAIATGGGAGGLARWGLAEGWPHPAGGFAWATLVANVSGCFLIGVLMVLLTEGRPPSRYARPFLGVGVLGGYTTFSTAMLDARSMIVAGHVPGAAAYLVTSVVAGLAAVWLAIAAARAAIAARRALLLHRRSMPESPRRRP